MAFRNPNDANNTKKISTSIWWSGGVYIVGY